MIKLKIKPFKWSKIRVVLVLLVFLSLVGGGRFVLARRAKATKLKIINPAVRDLQKEILLSGSIDANQKVSLQFQVSGKLAWVGVKEGDWVKKYQAIASLDKDNLRRAFQKKMTDYMKTRWDFEQNRDNYDYNKRWFELTDEEKRILEKDQFDLNKSVWDVETANLALKYATIITPIEGIVTKVSSPYPGVNITPSLARFEIVNPTTVYFRAEADQDDVVNFAPGIKAEISLDAYPDKLFIGQVENISFGSVSTTGTPSYKVKISLGQEGNDDLRFRLGMEGEARLVTAEKKQVLSIPLGVIKGGKNPWVYVLVDGKKVKKEIKTGLETEDWIEIVSGLSPQDKVVVD